MSDDRTPRLDRQALRAAIVAALQAHERAGGEHFEGEYPFDRHWRGRTTIELAATIYTTTEPTKNQCFDVNHAIVHLRQAGIVSTRRRSWIRITGGLNHGIEVVLGDFD